MNRRLIGFVIFVTILELLLLSYFLESRYIDYDLNLIIIIPGFATWIVGHFLSFHISKVLFQIQRIPWFHLQFNSSILPYEDFFIASRKRTKFWAFIIIAFVSFFLSTFCAIQVWDFMTPALRDEIEKFSGPSEISGKLVLTFLMLVFVTPLIYAIYIIDLSNLRVNLTEKKIISSTSTVFRSLFGGFAIYIGGFSHYKDVFESEINLTWRFDDLALAIIIMILLFSSNVVLSFMFLHFSEERLTKKFKEYLKSLGIKEKQYDIK